MPAAALHTPLAIGILSEDDINQALLLMAGLDLDVSLGYRIGRTSRLAWELALGTRGTLGVVERFRLQRGDPDLPRAVEGFASYVLPLGACLDFFPESGAGWFGSMHAGAGSFSGPEFMNSGNINIAGRLAADLGWVIPLDTGSLALSARYSLLGMKRLYIDEDYNNTLQLHELSFGVTWSL